MRGHDTETVGHDTESTGHDTPKYPLTKMYFERIRVALEQKIIAFQKCGKIPQDTNSQNLSVALFGIVIPGFTLQSVFMDEKKINSNIYADCLLTLFQDLS